MDKQAIHQRRWLILSVLVICLLVVILDNTILNVALKTIQEQLQTSQSAMQWAVDAYALVFAGLLITGGVLGDRLGRKKVLLFGMLAFGTTSALCSFAKSPGELIAFRALMGIGAAAVQPQTLSIIQNVFEPRERPKAIGIWAGASGAAIALGPIAGGALLKFFWWGSVFLVNVPIVVVGVIAILLVVPESRDPHPHRLEPSGVLLSIAAMVVLVYGIIEGGNTNDWTSWKSLGAILVGLALLALFVVLERRSDHPTIDMSLFRNRHFSAGTGAIALTFFALMGSTFYLAYYLQAVRGYTALAAGVALIAVAAAVMMAAPLSARLARRFGPRIVSGCGLALFGLVMLSYGLSTGTMPIWVVELQMFGMGIGMGLAMTPATNSIMSAVPREKAGAGSAVNNTSRQVAGALGVAILGSLVAVVFRTHLGAATPQQVAQRLGPPATTFVKPDTSESIGGALEFAGRAAQTAHQPQQLAVIGGFVSDSKDAFMSAMRVTSMAAGAVALLGSIVAFRYLPDRREFAGHGAPREPEPAVTR